MKRFLTGLFLFAFTLAFVHAAEPLKIGVVAPLSGNRYKDGEALRNSLLLAQEDHPDFKVKFYFEDTEDKLSVANLATRRLISLNHVDVIFTPYTQEANIVAPLCDKAGILHLSNCWNSNVIERSKLSFSLAVSFKNYGEAIVRLLKQNGYQRIAFVHNPEWVEGTDWLINLCKKENIEVFSESFMSDDRDFRTGIMRLREQNPDIYVVYLLYPSCDIFVKQLHELAPTSKVTGALDICKDRAYIEGATYISEYPPIPTFYARYQKRFGVSAEQTLAPNVYDSYQMLAKIASELPAWDVKAAADKFRSMKDFPGITGRLTCAPTGVFLSQTHVVKIVKGQKEFLGE